MKYNFLKKIEHHAKFLSHHQALVSNDKSLSYADLYQLIKNCTSILQQHDIGQGSIVGLSIPDEILHLIVSFSLLAVGAKQITLATHDSEPVRTNIAEQVCVTDIITTNKKYHLMNIGMILLSNDMVFRNTKQTNNISEGVILDDNEEQIYLRTSGTTGDINIVGFSQQQLALQSLRHTQYSDERFLKLNSTEHNNTKRHHLYCLYQGGTCIIRGTSSVPLSSFCHQHEVTWLELTRIHLADLARNFTPPQTKFFPETKIIATGSKIPYELRRTIQQRVTDKFYVRYGCTEFGSISFVLPDDHGPTESVGCPYSGVEIEIIGNDGEKLPSDMIGKIRIKADGMATHYVGNPEKSAHHFHDGWFYPGDMGSLRGDGTLTLHGRQDDMMIMNSLNIFPSEIEHVLEQHPSIKIACAVGIPSKVHGEIPVAAVELYDNVQTTAIELKAYARENLALKTPRKILILKSLPYSQQGKILRQKLIEIFCKEGA